jgi:putative endonuclease
VRERKTYFVYILGSLSGTLYIGITSHPEKRMWQHKNRVTRGFTSKYEVDRLLYWESFDDAGKAIDREKQLKGWRREKKIALIQSVNPQWLDLSRSWLEPHTLGRDASTPSAQSRATAQTPLNMTTFRHIS